LDTRLILGPKYKLDFPVICPETHNYSIIANKIPIGLYQFD